MTDPALRLVVLGDSTAFTDHRGPQLPDEPMLYPNVVKRQLEAELDRPVELTVLARAGLTVHEAAKLVTKDRHAQFDVLMGADAVVVGLGSFDNAPGGIPPVVDAVVPYIRNAVVRRRLRKGLLKAYPLAVRARQGRTPRTSPAEFARLYDLILLQVRGLARGCAGVALGPTSHRADYYAHIHPGHADAERRTEALAGAHGFPLVRTWPLVEPLADRLNVDGVHWPSEAHGAVGEAVARHLVAQLTGSAPRPPEPSWAWNADGA